MRVKLTDRFAKQAAPRGRRSPIFMDEEVIGFGLQVRETGRKSFTLDYIFEGRRRRLYIGDFPDWSTQAAREHAKLIKREIDQGIDPLAVRNERRTAPTVKYLIERYLTEHVVRYPWDLVKIIKTIPGDVFFDSWPFTGHVGKFDVRTFWRVIATRPRHRRIPRPRQ